MPIWGAHCNTVTIATIFLPLLIAHPNVWRLLLFLLFLWQTAQEHWFFIGSTTLGYPILSLQITGQNLLQIFGLSNVVCFTFRIARPALTVLT
jgi:hypothetical protein